MAGVSNWQTVRKNNPTPREAFYDIVIIGGGASGMIAAVCSSRFFADENRPVRIALIERHSKLGRKLLATGNGRCNLSNWSAVISGAADSGIDVNCADATKHTNINYPITAAKPSTNHYYSQTPGFCDKILEMFTPADTVAFFESIGILCRTKDDGKIYPFSDQSLSVVKCLEREIQSLGVDVYLSTEAKEIRKITECANTHFQIGCDNLTINAKKVIVSAGGKASPGLSSNGMGYGLLQSFGHTCTDLFPSIVQIRTMTAFTAPLSGIKWDASISLMHAIDGKSKSILRKETGELLFTNYGISGPPVLQLARHLNGFEAGKSKEQINVDYGARYYAVIDFLEEMEIKEVISLIAKRVDLHGNRPIQELLSGLFPEKLARALIEEAFPGRGDKLAKTLTNPDLAILVSKIKMLPIEITGTQGWEDAQVTAGGIRCDEINPMTMESRLCEGLYATGEMLDVDGDCGGYNLQFAWAGGFVAGKHAAMTVLGDEL